MNEPLLEASRVQTSRRRRRPVSNLTLGRPAGFFLPHLARYAAGSPPCRLYALVPPAFLPDECGLVIVRHSISLSLVRRASRDWSLCRCKCHRGRRGDLSSCSLSNFGCWLRSG